MSDKPEGSNFRNSFIYFYLCPIIVFFYFYLVLFNQNICFILLLNFHFFFYLSLLALSKMFHHFLNIFRGIFVNAIPFLCYCRRIISFLSFMNSPFFSFNYLFAFFLKKFLFFFKKLNSFLNFFHQLIYCLF